MKNLIFLYVATCIFIFSVIVLNFAPSINGLVGNGHYNRFGNYIKTYYGFTDYSCVIYSDEYNDLNMVLYLLVELKKIKINI